MCIPECDKLKKNVKYVGTLIATGAVASDILLCHEICLYYLNCIVWNLRADKRCEALSLYTGLEPDKGYTAGMRISHECVGRRQYKYISLEQSILQIILQ